MNGGYIMIDCKGLNLLAQSTQTISGLFERLTEAKKSGKPIILFNVFYGEGVPLTPFPIMMIEQGGEYCGSASILQVWVSSADVVRIVPLITDNRNVSATRSTKK